MLYEYRIDAAVTPTSLDGLVGSYRAPGNDSGLPVRIYLEKDQLYLQNPTELPLELYPDSASTVFHPFYNNTELKLAFQRNLLGQITGAQAQLVYSANEIINSYTLIKTDSLSNSQILWLTLLIVLIILTIIVFIIFRRRAGHKL
jgi:hypothetical protein